MDLHLDPVQVRVLGALIEKELTTPDYYPLTLNALTLACNQKSNRDPVLELEETEVVRALDGLRHQGLALQAGSGGRVPRYGHNLAGKLHLEPEELAVLAELLLRGPQTLGELRNRAGRMRSFAGLEDVEEILGTLLERDTPLAARLPRQPGRKESRYAHLLAGLPEPEAATEPSPEPARQRLEAGESRLAGLEAEVASLRKDLETLREELAAFRSQFE